jgi:hypothetical protein
MATQSRTKAPNTAAVDETLDRARLLQDRNFLQSNDKKLVKRALENYLADLDNRYAQKTSSKFPVHAEWERLQALSTQFAILLGKRRLDYGAWDSAIRLIESKYKKIPLRDFIGTIINRLTALPIPPCTSIYNVIEQSKEESQKTQLQVLYQTIRSPSWSFNVDSKPWPEWLQLIGRHPIATDKILRALLENKSIDQKTGAFLLFRQMHHEQLMWMMQYDQATEATRRWIYLLNNKAYYQGLKKVFHGSAASPEQMLPHLAQDKNRERRRKSYRKSRKITRQG